MAAGVELVHVRKGKQRVHLTPGVSPGAPVHTLCGKELGAEAEVTEAPVDCQACLRRQNDPAAISSAFFRDDSGSRLLELSLEAAKARREGRPDLRVVPNQRVRPAAQPPKQGQPAARPGAAGAQAGEGAHSPAAPEVSGPRGELDLTGLRHFSADVYLTPAGVIVRMDGERIVEVVTETKGQLLRTRTGYRIRFGDLVVEATEGNLRARLDR